MKVIAVTNVKHNGNVYKKGEELQTIGETQISALEDAGAVEIKGKKDRKRKAPVKKEPKKESTDKENASEVANIKPAVTMSKPQLRGIALARGMEVDKTLMRNEVLKLLKVDIKERGDLDMKPKKTKKTE